MDHCPIELLGIIGLTLTPLRIFTDFFAKQSPKIYSIERLT